MFLGIFVVREEPVKNADRLNIRDVAGGVLIAVKVVPGSSREGIVGVLGDVLKIATTAAPEKGKANAAVAKTLAKALGVNPRKVELITGTANSRKEYRVMGLSGARVRELL